MNQKSISRTRSVFSFFLSLSLSFVVFFPSLSSLAQAEDWVLEREAQLYQNEIAILERDLRMLGFKFVGGQFQQAYLMKVRENKTTPLDFKTAEIKLQIYKLTLEEFLRAHHEKISETMRADYQQRILLLQKPAAFIEQQREQTHRFVDYCRGEVTQKSATLTAQNLAHFFQTPDCETAALLLKEKLELELSWQDFPEQEEIDLLPLRGARELRQLKFKGAEGSAGKIKIKNMATLHHLSHLQTLSFSQMEVDFTDLSPSFKKQIKNLTYNNGTLTDLNFLTGFTQLKNLSLKGHQLSDLSPVSSLKNLRLLFLDHNKIADSTPLQKLKLQELSLEDNPLSVCPVDSGEKILREYCQKKRL